MSNEENKNHDENKGSNELSQDKKIEDQKDLQEQRNRKIRSVLKAIGIVLLVVIGIPVFLFGTCVLLTNGLRYNY